MAVAIGGAVALAVAMGIGRFIFTPILPFMEADLGWSKSDSGLVASANYLGYLFGALAAAWMRLPGGARYWFLSALLASALTTAMMAVVQGMTVYLAVRFASGVSSAFVLVLASSLVLARVMRVGRPGLFSLHFSGVGSGIAVTGVLVSVLAASGAAWPAFWLAGGALGVVGWLLAMRLVPAGDDEADDPSVSRQHMGALEEPMRRLIVSYGLFGFGYVILATFISAMVRDTPDIQWLESSIWIIVGLAGAPSVAIWSVIARRWGYGFTYVAAALVQAVGTLICVQGTAPAVIFGAMTLGGTIVALTAIGVIHARNLTPHDPRLVLGLMTGAFGLGQVVGPIFAGLIGDATGSLSWALAGASLALVGCAVLTPGGLPTSSSSVR